MTHLAWQLPVVRLELLDDIFDEFHPVAVFIRIIVVVFVIVILVHHLMQLQVTIYAALANKRECCENYKAVKELVAHITHGAGVQIL